MHRCTVTARLKENTCVFVPDTLRRRHSHGGASARRQAGEGGLSAPWRSPKRRKARGKGQQNGGLCEGKGSGCSSPMSCGPARSGCGYATRELPSSICYHSPQHNCKTGGLTAPRSCHTLVGLWCHTFVVIGMHLLHFDGRSTTLTFLVKDKWNLHGQTLEARAQPWGLERSQTSTPRPSATGCLSAGPMHGGTPVRNPAHSRNTSALDPRLLSGLHHSTSAKASRAWASSKAREGEWGRANSFVRNFPPGRRICSGGW